jgi:hypothetical protein
MRIVQKILKRQHEKRGDLENEIDQVFKKEQEQGTFEN